MALFELKQDTGSGAAAPWAPPTFKDCVAADIDAAFFEENEHADRHTVDGKDVLIVLEDDDLREHSAHWEAGAKQNFDTGLYTAHTILYIRVEDYGPKPKIGKQLVLDKGTKSQRTYTINLLYATGYMTRQDFYRRIASIRGLLKHTESASLRWRLNEIYRAELEKAKQKQLREEAQYEPFADHSGAGNGDGNAGTGYQDHGNPACRAG